MCLVKFIFQFLLEFTFNKSRSKNHDFTINEVSNYGYWLDMSINGSRTTKLRYRHIFPLITKQNKEHPVGV